MFSDPEDLEERNSLIVSAEESTPTPSEPVPMPAPQEQEPVVSKPAPPALSPETVAALDRLAKLEAKQAERDEADRKRDEAEAIKRGEYEKLLSSRDADLAKAHEKARDAEDRAKRTTRDRELALALAGQNLRPGAAKHLTKLLSDDLEAVPDSDGGYTVRSKDRRSVADFITDTLKQPDYDAFVSSTARTGVTPGGGTHSAPTPETPTTPAMPKNLGEAIMGAYTAVRSAPDNSTSSPRGFKAVR
jgi:hypothetical protein